MDIDAAAPTVSERLGLSGRLARTFLQSQLTPLLAVSLLLLGIFAVFVTPREEEPQIDVTFANIFIPFSGASSTQVESLVSTPMEKLLSEIAGIKHIYSVSTPGMSTLTVQYEVGVRRNDALIRLYNAVYSNQDWRPAGTGIGQPLIKPKGIDDVPIVALTLWSRNPRFGAYELGSVARSIESDLKRVPGTRNVDTIGDSPPTVNVDLDAGRLANVGLTVVDLTEALQAANLVRQAGAVVERGLMSPVQAGTFLADRVEVSGLVIAARDGKPVYLEDVATVTDQARTPNQYVWFSSGAADKALGLDAMDKVPAVTLAIAKKPGANAIEVATAVMTRVEQLKGISIPSDVGVTVTRNYGETANDKAVKLIEKLLFATLSVVALVLLAVGKREAIVVGAAVIVTLAATLFASWAWGFTINRVSLFALIFSIGILVDDAIVIVENIHRHAMRSTRPLSEVIPLAVNEVGGPTILATFTVIAALLPMAFVSGLMGPYMSPIPINASMGMLISLAVALTFTPWLCRLLFSAMPTVASPAGEADQRLHQRIAALLQPFLKQVGGRRARHRLYWSTFGAIAAAVMLVVVHLVVLKMLPFDNKSEFQVILNMPEGTPVEDTARVLAALGDAVKQVPEVSDYQAYVGTSAPINFNGLVRQYYLRKSSNLGDLQVNLVSKQHRSRKSHDIARAIRPALAAMAKKLGARSVQVVEVPPGPPVQAPLVAEIYGPNYPLQQSVGRMVRALFDATPDIVDTDDTAAIGPERLQLNVDRAKSALLGVSQAAISDTLAVGLGGLNATYIHTGREQEPIAVHLELSVADHDGLDQALALPAKATNGNAIPLSELISVNHVTADTAVYHKDLLPVTFVTGDMAGRLDSPLYGMFDLVSKIKRAQSDGQPMVQRFISAPDRSQDVSVKWDGEWTITYETFRDMGLAYGIGLICIYLLVVAQFRSYGIPLIIMAPIPLTVIGVLPGHALLGANFTATSMIGMIALAGIIVRNSILLVDFINAEVSAGLPLADAVVRAVSVRAKPIILTGLAAMVGGFFILDDPIFNGLAISLIFGILVSTVLTLLLIPLLYFGYLERFHHRID